MALNSCKLSEDGERARDELLELLYPGKSYTKAQIERETGMTRGDTLPKILGEKNGGIQLKKINQFFGKLLRKTIEGHENYVSLDLENINKYLETYKLVASYQRLSDPNFDMNVPIGFYIQSSNIVKQNTDAKQKSISKKNINNNLDCEPSDKESIFRKPKDVNIENIVDLFWSLDYKQENDFTSELLRENKFIACSIAAPCEITQRWILNRLMRHVPNVHNALTIAIDLSRSPMRYKFVRFWEELSGVCGVDPVERDIVQGLCHDNIDRPIILKIYNFQDRQNIQRRIVEDFWQVVTQENHVSERSEDSRLILLFIDRCCPDYDSSQVVKLDPLIDINRVDVRNWLYNPTVYNWWKPQFGSNFANDVLNECFGSQNTVANQPRSILDRICLEFGLENGVIEIEELYLLGEIRAGIGTTRSRTPDRLN